jgi:hypothetical protein
LWSNSPLKPGNIQWLEKANEVLELKLVGGECGDSLYRLNPPDGSSAPSPAEPTFRPASRPAPLGLVSAHRWWRRACSYGWRREWDSEVVKTNSSRWVHEQFPERRRFARQAGSSAFTVSASRAADVAGYIAAQLQGTASAEDRKPGRQRLFG